MTAYLGKKALLVTLNISQWTARKLDRKITDEVNLDHGAVADAGRYNKMLLPAKALATIQKVVGEARKCHENLTMPWGNNGQRLLAATLYEDYNKRMRVYEASFRAAVSDFVDSYPDYVEQRRNELNGMFRQEDYPTEAAIRSKFAWANEPAPLADADDFRVQVSEGHAEAIKAQIEATLKATAEAALREPLTRAVDLVGRMVDRLNVYQPNAGKVGSFRDSLVGNLEELADLLPAFNLSENPDIDVLSGEIKSRLCRESAQALRDNEGVRKAVAKDAADILARVESLLS